MKPENYLSENWHNLCQRLGYDKGISCLWSLFRSLSGKAKARLHIVEEMCVHSDNPAIEKKKSLNDLFFVRIYRQRALQFQAVVEVTSPLAGKIPINIEQGTSCYVTAKAQVSTGPRLN